LKVIRWLVLDVDGVLTDGRIILGNNGEEMKHFDVRDGHALKMIQRYDIHIMLLTGRTSQVVANRAKELNITEVHQRILNKLEYFTEFMNQRGLTFPEIAYVGDDVVDIPLLRQVGFSATVKDAAEEVFPLVDYISPYDGGRGAVRDICKLILKAQGKWREVAQRYHFPEPL
ncbi:MAG: HAD hydrolase family protein, partial [Syntrophobacterales bacterium]|nr:HAD hydrolase family protein [Syntrophobacterales bacterium]